MSQSPIREELAERLRRGSAKLGLALSDSVQAQLLAYLGELEKWNRSYNLTAVREPIDMLDRHLLDCLSILPHLKGEAMIDVGSGAGLPAIVVALTRPEIAVSAVESNGKKARFLRHCRRTLGLDNFIVFHERCERLQGRWPMVVSRAFASLDDFVALAGHLCAPDGCLLAMKARNEEGLSADSDFHIELRHDLQVPGLMAERRLDVLVPRRAAIS